MDCCEPDFDGRDVEVVARDVAYGGFFRIEKLTLRHALFAGGKTEPFVRELFERGEAVCVMLYDPQRDVLVFTEQFRVGAMADERSPWLIELVAGMVEPGESYEDVAHRETLEEAGCECRELIPVYRYWVSPGGTSERIQIYCGLIDSDGVEGIHGLEHEHEDIRLVRMSFEQACEALEAGVINNAAAIIAMQWLTLNRPQLRSTSAVS